MCRKQRISVTSEKLLDQGYQKLKKAQEDNFNENAVQGPRAANEDYVRSLRQRLNYLYKAHKKLRRNPSVVRSESKGYILPKTMFAPDVIRESRSREKSKCLKSSDL